MNQYSVWAVGNPGKIYKLNSMVGVQQISNEIPDNYFLSQNYPNPFNPSTNIIFKIPTDGLVKIRIYDILGKEIKTLINEYKNSGSYKIEFDAGSLASGIYFYRIDVNKFTDIKKMTIIK